jgi:hypothetical protein
MFGKKPEEYVRFERWILILIAVVFAARLALSLAGVPNEQASRVSVNLTLLFGTIYCAVAVHTTGFGTYKHLFPLLLFQHGIAHSLIALAIVLGILTGQDNIFTAPEYFGGADGKTWIHVVMHLIGGQILAGIMWLPGSLVLFLTRKLRP